MAKTQKPRDKPANAKLIATNRRARRDYEIVDTIEVGIVLKGSEVKTLRESNVQLAGAWAQINDKELWLHNLHIAPYSHAASAYAPEPGRTRKLLAHHKQILNLEHSVNKEHLTLIPLSMYFVQGKAKINLALAKGRTHADKRQAITKRDADREAARSMALHQKR